MQVRLLLGHLVLAALYHSSIHPKEGVHILGRRHFGCVYTKTCKLVYSWKTQAQHDWVMPEDKWQTVVLLPLQNSKFSSNKLAQVRPAWR